MKTQQFPRLTSQNDNFPEMYDSCRNNKHREITEFYSKLLLMFQASKWSNSIENHSDFVQKTLQQI